MGFSSWTTCDTKESIAVRYAMHKNSNRTVYLLQPNGAKPITEHSYEGYCEFGGEDVDLWIAKNNLKKEYLSKAMSNEMLMDYGCAIEIGKYYLDVNSGKKYSFHYFKLVDELCPFDGNYETVQKGYDKSPNELIADGTWVAKEMKDLLLDNIDKYLPLKFSFNKDAIYEEFPASERCPYQGYFYN